jgi:hypothetical protein
MNTHGLIDQFVRVIISVGVPVVPLNGAPWVEQFESKLPARLPASFRSLITRYAFPAFEVGSLVLFANSDGHGEEELTNAVFTDRAIVEVTHNAGYIQFARPADGSYDPICFDKRVRAGNQECPIVRLDHEAILIASRIVVGETIAKSFVEFVKSVIEMNEAQHGKIISVIERADS